MVLSTHRHLQMGTIRSITGGWHKLHIAFLHMVVRGAPILVIAVASPFRSAGLIPDSMVLPLFFQENAIRGIMGAVLHGDVNYGSRGAHSYYGEIWGKSPDAWFSLSAVGGGLDA